MIEAEQLEKSFGTDVPVLAGVSLKAKRGELLAVLGPSGCGKTTLLRLIAGLESPDAGVVRIDGCAPGDADLRLGYVFQDPNLLPWLTAAGNVELPLKLAGRERGVRQTVARELLGSVGLSGFDGHYPHALSGGMRMRVSLARALALRPGAMLFDEPFAAVDSLARNRLNEDLLALQQRDGWTGLFVTHSVQEAVFLARRVVVLTAGPARVHAVHEVGLPGQRDHALRGREAFHAEVAEVTRLLDAACDPGVEGAHA